ncbi:MAG: AlkA N-terminal domain-containing protein [Acidimicrobiales bacterium]
MIEDFEQCYRALQSRDPRFDGWWVAAVATTGVYCRPSCPATTPKRANVSFYPTAAAAQQAGYRACKRCRPNATPGSPEWAARSDVVARAMRLIADGAVDRDGVAGLGRQLGYSARHLERLLLAEVGTGPVALARAQRAQAARLLVETTDLAMSEVAFAAGFSSIRQFNATVAAVFATSPTRLRAQAAARGVTPAPGAHGLALRLPFRAPLCPDNLWGHLAATAVPGCEEVGAGTYRRSLRLAHGPGVVALRPTPTHVAADLALADLRDLAPAIARCRRLLDLDADPVAVDAALGTDAALAPVVAKSPGRRVPGAADEEEMAVRAVLGQQISTAAARSHAGRLVRTLGTPLPGPAGGLTHLWPTAGALAAADPATLGLPAARRATFAAVAGALAGGRLRLGPGADWAEARAALAAIPGVGPWTAEMVAMRALGDPDAFPATDLGVRRGAQALGIPTGPPADLVARAQRWRPWRAYAVVYLWSVLDHPVNRWPGALPAGPRPRRSRD